MELKSGEWYYYPRGQDGSGAMENKTAGAEEFKELADEDIERTILILAPAIIGR